MQYVRNRKKLVENKLKLKLVKQSTLKKLNAEAGDKVTFEEVVFVGGDDVKVGAPFVAGATVEGTVEKQGRQKKVVTFKYKRRKDSHRKQGHRQPYTKVVIDAINA